MDSTEFCDKSANDKDVEMLDKTSSNDFPFLFGSKGLFKHASEDFNKNQNEFHTLNLKVEEVQQENSKLKNDVKTWVQRKGQFALALKNMNNTYPSSVSPKDHEDDDEVYHERYAIAQEFISGWRTCIDEMQNYQKMCDELDKYLEEIIQKNKNNMNQSLSQLAKFSSSGRRFNFMKSYLFKHFKPSIHHSKRHGCCNFNFSPKRIIAPIFNKMIQIENLFIEIRVNLDSYQHDITVSKDKIREYRKLLDRTILQLNRIRMARTPAYSKQAQQCSVCNKPYVYLKWCKFCDREQFQQQFSNWESGNPKFDKIIRDSQLSIKFPNGFIQWIPYEKFTNLEFVGSGAFAKVYKASWVEGLGIWDYALGKRVRYPNTPVALKELKDSQNISNNFLEEVIAYIKSSSSTVLRCYGISKNPVNQNYIIVFPYAHGGSLRHYMRKRLNWVNKLDVLRHMLYGLDDIHKRGLVHRDLHPGNLLHYRRTISVSDLGFCRPADDESESEKIFGVLPFIAPEVLDGEPYTQASDVYSVGMIMWFIISGQYPFCDRKYNDHHLAGDIMKGLRPKVPEGTPPDYEKLMRNCWDPDPHKRPTAGNLYQKVLFWLNEFNKNPLPNTIQQFITSRLESFDGLSSSNDEHVSCDLSKIITRKSNLEKNMTEKISKDDKEINTDFYNDEDDEWNTIHINDYQNWLYKLDIMNDFSEEKIASIVATNHPQLEFTEPQPQLSITKIVEEKKSISNEGIDVSNNFESYTKSL
ncbi:kinase-like domain-containing protein [Glomus cerebriforme]|uniref:Kinase-like domain-containing protein n=1 Tax=Glomus cerebriforme TaxID=658196 RepID=A0A397SLQ2_9GLOM|nr:kinase-like domain-containing protein [Glomus cerebriforme]